MGRKVPERVLFVLLGAIGDVVRALPLLCRLRRHWAETRFYWAAEPAAAELLEQHPALSGTVVYERGAGPAAFLRFLLRVRSLGAELALDLQRHAKSGLVSRFSGAPRRLGFARENSREGNFLFQTEAVPAAPHESSKLAQFLRFADVLGVPPAPVEFGIVPDREGASRLLGPPGSPYVVAYVGSTAPSRLWSPARTSEVVRWLRGKGFEVVLVGGVGDRERVRELGATGAVDLVGRTSLRELAAVLEGAVLAFGPDSGPMHLAAAVGTPVVSLWGPTSAARSAPFGFETLVVEGDAPCRPCFRKTCPIGALCMERIGVADVVAKLERALEMATHGRAISS
ncbi:MAG: lipopolysaccharide heptosyltransferase I [Candidatus Binatia bacterium]|nr:MAG: lipopolysaccharide heptosyltransferase I [Candidatus Binatia bacterium]